MNKERSHSGDEPFGILGSVGLATTNGNPWPPEEDIPLPPEPDDDERSPFPPYVSGNGEHSRNAPGNDEPPTYVDVAKLLDGGLPDPPAPVLLTRTDGIKIFYKGQVNLLFGDPESGKTLVAQAAAAEALIDRKRGAFIDIDHNGPEAIVCRFLDMGVPEETLRDPNLFRYVEPEDKPHLMAVIKALKAWRPAVAVVDSVGELLPLMGLSSNSPDDFTTAHTATLKALAMTGAAVIAIDHLAKGADSRTQGSTGTAAKKRAVGGVSIRVTVEEQFAPGQGGAAFLTIHKDRHGGLRQHCPPAPGKEQVAGLFKIAAETDRISWTVEGPKPGDVPKADRVDPADLAELDKLVPPPSSVRDVKGRLSWSSVRATNVLRAWRSQRSRSVPGEQGTRPGTDRSPLPDTGAGNTEQPRNGTQGCSRCKAPADRLIHSLCPTCAYPSGDAPEHDDAA